MKAGKTWCLAGLMVFAGFSSASCGKDEGLEGAGGSGNFVDGGADQGGAGGSKPIGRGGAAVVGGTGGIGTGGTEPGVSPTKLGRACMADADCADAKAPGLKCITDDTLGDGAPPGGLCTLPCNPQSQEDECGAVGPGALCFPFSIPPDGEEPTEGYCVEGCAFGEPEIGVAKCHNRVDFSCNPALLGNTEEPCVDEGDCNAGEICTNDTCHVVFPACLPSCRGDIDCAEGTYCDQSFLAGLCVDEKPTGKALGEPCTVPAENEPSEPDECLGFCQRDAEGSSAGHCVTNCSLLNQCAWNSETEKFDGACLYVSALDPNGAEGDFGFCMPACNCTDECQDETLRCIVDGQELPPSFKGPGLCFPADEDGENLLELNECTGTGGGGAGSGGAGTGEAGAGASPGGGGEGGKG
jgi:hypothetical protein